MSARCTGQVFDRYPVGGGEFALALALADNAHDDGANIFISVPSMAVKSRQSVRSVQAHLQTMLRAKWLQITQRGGGAGRYTKYRINPEWLKGAELAGFSDRPKGADSAGFSAPKRVQNDAQKGAEQRTPYRNRKNRSNPPLPPQGGAHRKTPTTRDASAELPPGLAAIAAAYGRRAGMPQAVQQWQALQPDEALQATMLQAIAAWKRSDEWQRSGGQYKPSLWKWLRDRRWLDAPGMGDAPRVVEQLPPSAPAAPMPADVRAKIDAIVGKRRKAVPA